jgi:hypothetical protein
MPYVKKIEEQFCSDLGKKCVNLILFLKQNTKYRKNT